MIRLTLTLFALLAPALASAANDVPDAPTSRVPTMSVAERKAAIANGELPELILPFRNPSNGRPSGYRYYTAEGEVLRGREVVLVLRASPAADLEMAEFERHEDLEDAWLFVTIATTLTVPIFCVAPLVGVVEQDHRAELALARALAAHNATASQVVASVD